MKMNRPFRFPHMADYDVGYKKPPKSGQFRQGKSGNPSGRPKGARNRQPQQLLQMRTMLLDEAYRHVTIQDKAGPLTLPVAQAAMRALALKAAQGNVGAQKLFLQSLHYAETEQSNEQHAIFEAAILYKKRAYAAIADSERHGIPLKEEPLPHPDHVITDIRVGEVLFTGPIDRQDKERWDDLWMHKASFEEEIAWLQKLLKKEPDDRTLEDDIASSLYCLELIERAIITSWHRPVKEVVKDPARHYDTQYRIENDILPQRPKRRRKATSPIRKR